MTRIPTATAEQMASVDRIMMDELGVDVLQLMEAAGLAVAEAIRRRLGGDVAGRRVLLLAGTGGNGGDALVTARHLLARGAVPTVVLSKPATTLPGVTAHQHRVAAAVGVPFVETSAFEEDYDLIVDGLLGFSGRGDPHASVAGLIRQANAHAAPVLALVLPKRGFLGPDAQRACGEVMAGDIGVPNWVLQRVGIEAPAGLFAREQVVLWAPDD